MLARWGAPGSGDGQFNRPAGVEVDDEGNIYVADWGNEQVQVLSPKGEVLAKFRGESVPSRWANDYFAANPEEAAARQEANLEPTLIPRPERYREESANIEKYLWGLTSVKLDAQGRTYIVDRCRHRIQVYQKGA